MKKQTKKLYRLNHLSVLDGVETPIMFRLNDGTTTDKLTLTTIDSFTTMFESKYELSEHLKKLYYNIHNNHYFIEYQNNHERKKLDLIFSDQKLLKKFALDNQDSYTVKPNSDFYRYLYYVINDVTSDSDLVKYLREKNYMSSWLYENVYAYLFYKEFDVEASHIYMTRIKSELSHYKVIRSLEIGIKEYKNLKEYLKQNEDEANKEIEETNQELTEEKPKVLKKRKTRKKYTDGQGQLFDPDNY